ncbi:MAG TPA: hypothetical protein VHE81_04630 [Lacipirellulaceae bacterium]|nr:hypothetical protein [Lacipirellulaceae bacterium]
MLLPGGLVADRPIFDYDLGKPKSVRIEEDTAMSLDRYRIIRVLAYMSCGVFALSTMFAYAKDKEESVLVNKPAAAAENGPILPPPAKRSSVNVSEPQTTTPPAANSPAKQPFMRPAEPLHTQPKSTVPSEGLPAPAGAQTAPLAVQPAVHVHPAPPINYDTHHRARRMYRSGQVEVVMVAQDPANGCCYEIPLCIPACCTGAPAVSSGRGIFGRGVVEYCWSCGFKAKVKFRHVLGDVKVDYEVD